MLTVIVPVYNERKFVSIILNKLIKVKIKKLQIIVVDDCSNDGSTEILKKNFLKNKKISKIIFHKKNSGKGSAIKSAQKFIKGKYVIIQDADLEYNPKDITRIYNYIKKYKLKVVFSVVIANS